MKLHDDWVYWLDLCTDVSIAPYTWGTPPVYRETGRPDEAQAETTRKEGGD